MEAVDSARGDVPRNLWIVRLLEREVWGVEGSVLGKPGGPLKPEPEKPARSPEPQGYVSPFKGAGAKASSLKDVL